MKLAVGYDLAELQDFLGCLINEVEVGGACLVFLVRLQGLLQVPQVDSRVVRGKYRLTIVALGQGMYMELMDTGKGFLQLDWVPILHHCVLLPGL